jgi:hypothetical protein
MNETLVVQPCLPTAPCERADQGLQSDHDGWAMKLYRNPALGFVSYIVFGYIAWSGCTDFYWSVAACATAWHGYDKQTCIGLALILVRHLTPPKMDHPRSVLVHMLARGTCKISTPSGRGRRFLILSYFSPDGRRDRRLNGAMGTLKSAIDLRCHLLVIGSLNLKDGSK